jgi:hypothetical protein
MQLNDETGRAFPVWAETYSVGEREWRRLLHPIGAVTPEEALAPLQRAVLRGEQLP